MLYILNRSFTSGRGRAPNIKTLIKEEDSVPLQAYGIVAIVIVMMSIIVVVLFTYSYNKLQKEKSRIRGDDDVSFYTSASGISGFRSLNASPSQSMRSVSGFRKDKSCASVNEADMRTKSAVRSASQHKRSRQQDNLSDDDMEDIPPETSLSQNPKNLLQGGTSQKRISQASGLDNKSLLSTSSATTPLMQKRSKGKMIKEGSKQSVLSGTSNLSASASQMESSSRTSSPRKSATSTTQSTASSATRHTDSHTPHPKTSKSHRK